MEQQQRQKVMLGALAVLALGAGSYYVFFSGSGGPNLTASNEASTGRKERAAKAEVKTEKRREKPKEAAAAAEPAGRKEREAPEETAGGRKEKARGGAAKEKKKEIKPAA